MGDTAGERADRLQFLRLLQLLGKLGELGDIAQRGDKNAPLRLRRSYSVRCRAVSLSAISSGKVAPSRRRPRISWIDPRSAGSSLSMKRATRSRYSAANGSAIRSVIWSPAPLRCRNRKLPRRPGERFNTAVGIEGDDAVDDGVDDRARLLLTPPAGASRRSISVMSVWIVMSPPSCVLYSLTCRQRPSERCCLTWVGGSRCWVSRSASHVSSLPRCGRSSRDG